MRIEGHGISVKKILLAAGGLIVLAVIWSFIWGPLFAWGPMWGYERQNWEKVVSVAKDSSSFSGISNLDEVITGEEASHGLEYKHKVKIIITNSRGEWKRFVPWLSYSIGGGTMMTGNTIYINREKIDSRGYNLDGFFKHELSHELLYQNSSLSKAYRMYKQNWVEEGVATYFGGPYDYYASKDEFLNAYREAKLVPGSNPLLLYENLDKQNGKLSYTTYRYFFEYLSGKFGEEKLRKFIGLYTQDPGNFENEFKDSFGVAIHDAVEDFDQVIKS